MLLLRDLCNSALTQLLWSVTCACILRVYCGNAQNKKQKEEKVLITVTLIKKISANRISVPGIKGSVAIEYQAHPVLKSPTINFRAIASFMLFWSIPFLRKFTSIEDRMTSTGACTIIMTLLCIVLAHAIYLHWYWNGNNLQMLKIVLNTKHITNPTTYSSPMLLDRHHLIVLPYEHKSNITITTSNAASVLLTGVSNPNFCTWKAWNYVRNAHSFTFLMTIFKTHCFHACSSDAELGCRALQQHSVASHG